MYCATFLKNDSTYVLPMYCLNLILAESVWAAWCLCCYGYLSRQLWFLLAKIYLATGENRLRYFLYALCLWVHPRTLSSPGIHSWDCSSFSRVGGILYRTSRCGGGVYFSSSQERGVQLWILHRSWGGHGDCQWIPCHTSLGTRSQSSTLSPAYYGRKECLGIHSVPCYGQGDHCWTVCRPCYGQGDCCWTVCLPCYGLWSRRPLLNCLPALLWSRRPLLSCLHVLLRPSTNLSVLFIAVLPEPLGGSSALSAPLRWSSAPPLLPGKLPAPPWSPTGVPVWPESRWSVPPALAWPSAGGLVWPEPHWFVLPESAP